MLIICYNIETQLLKSGSVVKKKRKRALNV